MMWLTWRQFRTQAIVALAGLAVLAVVLGVTGLHLYHLYDGSGLPACAAHGDCASLASKFINQLSAAGAYQPLFLAGLAVMYVVPALIGVFWGAPLVTREIEAGTFRLAWNQSVTRNRWLAVKLGLVGLAAMATAGLFSLIASWWASPIESAIQIGGLNGSQAGFSLLDPLVFGARGIAPIGYAAFAVALGISAGVLIRRTVPAMAVTLAGFAAVQLAWPVWVRPHLFSPVTASASLNTANVNELMIQNGSSMTVVGAWTKPGAWVLSNQTITPAGHVFTGPPTQACLGNSIQSCTAWLASKHLRQLVSYQPASRFWAFQWYETALFLALAVALAGFCAWRISRRRIA